MSGDFDRAKAPRSFTLDSGLHLTFGPGEVARVGEFVRDCGGERALIVTDPGVRRAGIADEVLGHISDSVPEAAIFDGVNPNPTTDDVESGVALLRDGLGVGGTVVVAVGGGSAMDAAKAIALCATNGLTAREMFDAGEDPRPGLPLIAVPTTAGTAAETNGFGVITDPERGRKAYIGDESVKPRRSILDPELTLGLPPGITAATGIDALSHALESLMSRNANPFAEALALGAAREISAWLPRAVERGDDLEARSHMLLASNLAGQAFATGTGLGLCHAIAHPLGARLGVPHGLAIAGLLPDVMSFNLPAVRDELALAAVLLGGAGGDPTAEAAVESVEALISTVLGANPLADVTLDDVMLETVVRDCLEDPVINNTPLMPEAAQVEDLLRGVCR